MLYVIYLQLSGLLVLAVGLWLRFDSETVELLTGDGAPDTFFIGRCSLHSHLTHKLILNIDMFYRDSLLDSLDSEKSVTVAQMCERDKKFKP